MGLLGIWMITSLLQGCVPQLSQPRASEAQTQGVPTRSSSVLSHPARVAAPRVLLQTKPLADATWRSIKATPRLTRVPRHRLHTATVATASSALGSTAIGWPIRKVRSTVIASATKVLADLILVVATVIAVLVREPRTQEATATVRPLVQVTTLGPRPALVPHGGHRTMAAAPEGLNKVVAVLLTALAAFGLAGAADAKTRRARDPSIVAVRRGNVPTTAGHDGGHLVTKVVGPAIGAVVPRGPAAEEGPTEAVIALPVIGPGQGRIAVLIRRLAP